MLALVAVAVQIAAASLVVQAADQPAEAILQGSNFCDVGTNKATIDLKLILTFPFLSSWLLTESDR